jgi:hypothetical protein
MLDRPELGESVAFRFSSRAVHDDRRAIDGRSEVFEEGAQDEVGDV